MSQNSVMQHPFIDCRRVSGYSYYMIPKAMLNYGKKLGIGTDEVLLYTILRERTKLSLRNNLIDESGRVYIYYTRPQVATYLGWSVRKTVTVFKKLTETGLLDEVEERNTSTGANKAKRLYVKLWQEPSFTFSLEDIHAKRFPYASAENLLTSSMGEYYELPKLLVEHEIYQQLSIRSKLLYALTLDRLYLSLQYNRIDENGLVWTTLDTDIVTKELGCSERSLSRDYKELEDCGLLVRKAVNYGEKWRIYLRDYMPLPMDPLAEPNPTPSCEESADSEQELSPQPPVDTSDANFAPQSRQFCMGEAPNLHVSSAIFASPETPNLHPSKPPVKNRSLINLSEEENIPGRRPAPRDDRSLEREERLEAMQRAYDLCHYDEVIEYIYRKQPDEQPWVELLDQCVQILFTDLKQRGQSILFGRQPVPRTAVIERYQQLMPEMVYLLLESMGNLQTEVKDPQAYLHRALYEAPVQRLSAARRMRMMEALPGDSRPGGAAEW